MSNEQRHRLNWKILARLEPVRQKLTGAWTWARSTLAPPSVDAVIAEESKWAKGYTPQGNADGYSIVAQYAEKQYERILDHFDTIDKKAEEHLRFMVTLVAAVTALAASKVVRFEHPYVAGLGLIVLSVAFLAAMRVRTPMSNSFPMSPRALLGIADLDSKPGKHEIESVIVATYQVTFTWMNSIIEWKSRMLKLSTCAFILGFGLLLGSLIPN